MQVSTCMITVSVQKIICNISFTIYPYRFNSDLSKYCDIMPGEQRSGVRNVGAARPQVLPDTAHGASGPPRWVLEASRFRRLGSQTGENKYIHAYKSEHPVTTKFICSVKTKFICPVTRRFLCTKNYWQLDSTPAWPQEAYRPRLNLFKGYPSVLSKTSVLPRGLPPVQFQGHPLDRTRVRTKGYHPREDQGVPVLPVKWQQTKIITFPPYSVRGR